MFIFTLKEIVIGICDEEHLKESIEKIWAETCKSQVEKDVIIYYIDSNTGDCSPSYISSFCFYKQNDGAGLRMIGLSDMNSNSLGVKMSFQ